ncbi:Hypp7112 [Branchiostoma lanceolatum]|uniref:Hypp7112 protein n=1 Tax=Branchiostoma lanceolatum TaxID=7740 RepID=A0A8J9YX99_BRALA|nr:Hypp7112 [Branchiostoma lanceolatum]
MAPLSSAFLLGADPADFHSQRPQQWSRVGSFPLGGWLTCTWVPRLASIRTRNIVPVDLNAMMCLNEVALTPIYQKAGDCRSDDILLTEKKR